MRDDLPDSYPEDEDNELEIRELERRIEMARQKYKRILDEINAGRDKR